MKSLRILALIIFILFLFGCQTDEIFLHGDIIGLVTDASTGEPVEAASVWIEHSNDSTTTESDGTYLLKSLNPGQYEIQASKFTYALYKKNVTVSSAETKEIDIPLIGIPEPNPSHSFLDFRSDSTSLSFSISNIGKGKFLYIITPSQTWITISPVYGDVTNETDNITVTIDKTGLSGNIYKESIKITSFAGQDLLGEIIIPIYLNGVMDHEGNYYKVVRIGTQTYMAENIKATKYDDGMALTLVTDKTAWNTSSKPGYCWYNDAPAYKDTYGALYNWYAVNSGKLCPAGWHIPTNTEWITLRSYLGGVNVGNKLKEIGTTHWLSPNDGTNESGFTALPGGYRNIDGFPVIGTYGAWWSSTEYSPSDADDWFVSNSGDFSIGHDIKPNGLSVRCLKN
jgi:uncharacterized protein (TIGR02145 family)